ncbi:MAG: YvrJ family protein [Syntrophothermus sp.]|uniref:YvrJ family protein n=1 Tax=Syntrophothermus sp. TaxID=2736299 RepID=UPI00257D0680|nr:YvrJ family protein [Syntrophothermus sp.]NSW83885.1 YvrJ family protein [Syntrophothermus sp.]
MTDLLVQIGNYGFPAVVCIYLLVRIDKKLEDLTGAIVQLREALIEVRAGEV